jgi:hypothetical protein
MSRANRRRPERPTPCRRPGAADCAGESRLTASHCSDISWQFQPCNHGPGRSPKALQIRGISRSSYVKVLPRPTAARRPWRTSDIPEGSLERMPLSRSSRLTATSVISALPVTGCGRAFSGGPGRLRGQTCARRLARSHSPRRPTTAPTFFDAYVQALIDRDVRAAVRDPAQRRASQAQELPPTRSRDSSVPHPRTLDARSITVLCRYPLRTSSSPSIEGGLPANHWSASQTAAACRFISSLPPHRRQRRV